MDVWKVKEVWMDGEMAVWGSGLRAERKERNTMKVNLET